MGEEGEGEGWGEEGEGEGWGEEGEGEGRGVGGGRGVRHFGSKSSSLTRTNHDFARLRCTVIVVEKIV